MFQAIVAPYPHIADDCFQDVEETLCSIAMSARICEMRDVLRPSFRLNSTTDVTSTRGMFAIKKIFQNFLSTGLFDRFRNSLRALSHDSNRKQRTVDYQIDVPRPA